MDFRCVDLLQFFHVCDHNVSFPDSLRIQYETEEKTWQDFCAKLMQSRLVFRISSVIFDHCSKRYYWSVKGHPETPLIWCKEILNVSQIAVTFHINRLPFVTQTGLQQHRRSPFFHSAHCSLTNPICFRSVSQFQGIVSVNDFWFSLSAPGTSLGSSGSPGKFLFTRVGLYPLSCQILHHHGISMIVSRFTFFSENFVIRCDQVTEMFRSGHDCTSTSSARRPCYFRPQADIAIWVLRKLRIYTVLTRTRFHFCSRLH